MSQLSETIIWRDTTISFQDGLILIKSWSSSELFIFFISKYFNMLKLCQECLNEFHLRVWFYRVVVKLLNTLVYDLLLNRKVFMEISYIWSFNLSLKMTAIAAMSTWTFCFSFLSLKGHHHIIFVWRNIKWMA